MANNINWHLGQTLYPEHFKYLENLAEANIYSILQDLNIVISGVYKINIDITKIQQGILAFTEFILVKNNIRFELNKNLIIQEIDLNNLLDNYTDNNQEINISIYIIDTIIKQDNPDNLEFKVNIAKPAIANKTDFKNIKKLINLGIFYKQNNLWFFSGKLGFNNIIWERNYFTDLIYNNLENFLLKLKSWAKNKLNSNSTPVDKSVIIFILKTANKLYYCINNKQYYIYLENLFAELLEIVMIYNHNFADNIFNINKAKLLDPEFYINRINQEIFAANNSKCLKFTDLSKLGNSSIIGLKKIPEDFFSTELQYILCKSPVSINFDILKLSSLDRLNYIDCNLLPGLKITRITDINFKAPCEFDFAFQIEKTEEFSYIAANNNIGLINHFGNIEIYLYYI